MNVDTPSPARSSRRKWLLLAALSVAALGLWWLNRPAYLDFDLPLPPSEQSLWWKSYITIYDEMSGAGRYFGGTRYIVRCEGLATDDRGWTRAKLVDHFHAWLCANGWEPTRDEEEGLGIDHLWEVDKQGFRHRRYQRIGDTSSNISAILSVQNDRTDCTAGLWTVIVETKNPSWWTQLRDALDD